MGLMKEAKLSSVVVLGSGTSTGVPLPGCCCRVCLSEDTRNKRLRTSIALNFRDTSSEDSRTEGTIIVDTGPDFRYQVLRANITRINAVLYTHTHADHIFGLDDLRSFNFCQGVEIPIFVSEEHVAELTRIFSYAFTHRVAQSAGATPCLEVNLYNRDSLLNIGGLSIEPIYMHHGRESVYGFRIDDFAYLTDCSHIPHESVEKLSGIKTLILDGLRERSHPTHFNFQQAVDFIEQVNPNVSYLIHLSHECDYEESIAKLRTMSDRQIHLAFDMMKIVF